MQKSWKCIWSMVFPFCLQSPALSPFRQWFLSGLLQLACELCYNTVCYCWKSRAGKHLPMPEKLAWESLLVPCSRKSTSGFARSAWWRTAGKSAPAAPSPSPCTPSRTSAAGGWLSTGSWHSKWLAGTEELWWLSHTSLKSGKTKEMSFRLKRPKWKCFLNHECPTERPHFVRRDCHSSWDPTTGVSSQFAFSAWR